MQRSLRYCLMGDPRLISNAHYAHGHIFNLLHETRIVLKTTIASQHDEQPLLTGPLALNVTFYFPCSRNIPCKPNICRYAIELPPLENFVKYLTALTKDICYENTAFISSINALKIYDKIPRTEFILSELK